MEQKERGDITFNGARLRYKEERHGDHMIINEHFAMLISGKTHRDFLSDGTVYQYHNHVVVFVTAGSADVIVNMEETTWHQGDIVMMSSYTMLEPKGVSDDFDMIAICVEEDVPVNENFVLHTTKTEWQEMVQMSEMLWTIAGHKPFRKEVVSAFAAAIINNIHHIASERMSSEAEKPSNDERIFRRFREQVEKNADHERSVSFYAKQLCLSPNYLTTVVSKYSGDTVTKWINRTVILRAKVLLKTTGLMTSEIARQLKFSDHATFSKFFKRETGFTPREFRSMD